VRIGVLGQIGRFRAVDASRYQRGTSVICRTSRGLEFGLVLNVIQNLNRDLSESGRILRKASPEDHLLWARIEKNRTSAISECRRLLLKHRATTSLMDVELLFDGRSIFFYFLGDITPEIDAMTSELAEAYEATVQLRQFASAMTQGCGPNCGTEEGGGCSDGGCSSCSIVGGCSTKDGRSPLKGSVAEG